MKLYKNISVLLIAAVILVTGLSRAQNLISGAESVAFDTLNNRYLVSSLNNQKIIAIDENGNQSIYKEQIGAFGNCIKDNVFYVSGGNTRGVKGIDLATGEIIMNVIFSDTQQLDGVTTDDSGNLYVVETIRGFIHKLNLNDLTQSVLTSTGSGRFPQDIIFDKFQNRLLICYWHERSPVVSYSFDSGILDTVLVTDTGFFDGITIDDEGNFYLASHVDGGKIVMYDNDFTNGGHVIYQGIDEPAGLDYNFRDDVLAVPSFVSSSVTFLKFPIQYLNGNFEASITSGHAPLTINFVNKSNSSDVQINYEWDFDNDGSIDSFEENPTFIYSEEGNYSVRLVVTADTMRREIIFEDYIHVFNGETALKFLNVTDRVVVEANESIDFGNTWTIEMWTKPSILARKRLLDKNFISIYTNRNPTSTLNAFSIAARIYLADGSNITISTSDSSYIENEWQHLALVYNYDEKLFNIFINGVNQSLDFSNDKLFEDLLRNDETDDLVIGNNKLFSSGFLGLIDDVRIWSSAKTEQEIQQTMGIKLTGEEDNLISAWNFNEGNGTTALDMSLNQNNGILHDALYVQGIDFSTITNVKIESPNELSLPAEYLLKQNYPNPFNPTTNIDFYLPRGETVLLQVLNTNGEIVSTLQSEHLSAGTHSLTWNGENSTGFKVSSGVYFYRLIAGHKLITRKMLLLK